jgi:SAM-dependent methyltransferase
MSSSARFWDRIAKRYARQSIADEDAYQKKLQRTREYFQPDMEVLEIGCGTGSTAIAHAPFVRHIRAIDISANMIDIARGKLVPGKTDKVSFEQSTIDEYSAPDESLDAVLALSILHLLESRDEAIRKIHRLLKPGGVFVSSTACLGDSMKYIRFIAPIGHFLGLLPMLKVFTVQELERSIADAGFEIDYRWQPEKSMAVFIIAKKVTQA